MANFQVKNGQMLAPDGSVWYGIGINLYDSQMGSINTVLATFPNINIIRLNCYNFNSPSYYQSFINTVTAKGIVVELEDHTNNAGNAGGSQGTIFTGQTLANELNWYSSIAAAFASNPYVWFGTNNEPSETDSNGQTNAAALSTWQQQTYNAIRNAGNKNPVMIELNSWGVTGTAIGYTPAAYKAMTNVIWDMHYYGWLSNYSTDQNLVTSTLTGMVNASKAIPSADGVMPVFIGEFGPSTNGQSTDANGNQVLSAVENSAVICGCAPWGWSTGQNDNLTDGNGHLTSYGQQVAQWMAQKAASAPAPAPGPTPAPVPTPAGYITPSSGGSVQDTAGNVWQLNTAGALLMNNSVVAGGQGTSLLTVVNGVIWAQDAASLKWYTYTGGQFVAQPGQPPAPPTPTPAPTATPKPTPAPTATPKPTPTPAPTHTPVPTPSPSASDLAQLKSLLTQAQALLVKIQSGA